MTIPVPSISLYFSPITALAKPTGASLHALHMAAALAERTDVRPSWLAPQKAFREVSTNFPPSARDLPVQAMPHHERLSRRALLSGLARMERWSGEVDWVYCPKEQPVATKTAKLAVTIHDVLPFEPALGQLRYKWSPTTYCRWRFTIKQVLRRADLILCDSEFTRERLLELFVPEERPIAVVPCGVDLDLFKPDDQNHDDLARLCLPDRPFLLVIGKLYWRKGADRLLGLVRLMKDRSEPIDVVVTGQGHEISILRRIASEQLTSIRLAGYVPRKDLPTLLRKATALIFLSRYEGFGLPVLEAMASGCPVVCTPAGALPEVAGDAAWYVTGEDPEETLAAVERTSRLCEEVRRKIELGRRRATSFSWKRSAQQLVDTIRELDSRG